MSGPLDHLTAIAGPVTAKVTAPKFDLTGWVKPAGFEVVRNLAEGLGYEDKPLDPRPILKGCAFLRTAMAEGGKTYTNPMWLLTTLSATFMKNGREFAHAFSDKHPTYTKEETDSLYDRKLADREAQGLGWPSCAAIKDSGCNDCDGCPHFAKGKSPLNLGPSFVHLPALAPPITSSITASDLLLPPGYIVDGGLICLIVSGKKDQDDYYLPLFKRPVSDPWVEDLPNPAFHFKVQVGVDRDSDITIPVLATGSAADMVNCLHGQLCLVEDGMGPAVRKLVVDWMSHMWQLKAARKGKPYGWLMTEAGVPEGFVYGGEVIYTDGTRAPSGAQDPALAHVYQPSGDIAPWRHACKLVTDQKRPEFDTLIAAAFAAPLMAAVAKNGVFLSAWGPTGSGKTTAMAVSQAVWGSCKGSKEVSTSSPKSLLRKLGQLSNLPIYLDEIQEKDEVYEALQRTVRTVTEGTDGNKVDPRTMKLRTDKGQWQSMAIGCGNKSYVGFVIRKGQAAPASIARVFEYWVYKADKTAPGRQLTDNEVSRSTQALEYNYGHIGVKYAAYLAANHADVWDRVGKMQNAIDAEVNMESNERYWTSTIAVLLVGAEIANTFDIPLDVAAMHKFLVAQFYENRKTLADEDADMGAGIRVQDILTAFMKTVVHLWTTSFPMGKGRPAATTIVGEAPPSWMPINCRWIVDERRVIISRTAFNEYLDKAGIDRSETMKGLKQIFGAYKMNNVTLVSGCSGFKGGRETVINIPVPEGSPFEERLLARLTKEQVEQSVAVARAAGHLPAELFGGFKPSPVLDAAAEVAANDLQTVKDAA